MGEVASQFVEQQKNQKSLSDYPEIEKLVKFVHDGDLESFKFILGQSTHVTRSSGGVFKSIEGDKFFYVGKIPFLVGKSFVVVYDVVSNLSDLVIFEDFENKAQYEFMGYDISQQADKFFAPFYHRNLAE